MFVKLQAQKEAACLFWRDATVAVQEITRGFLRAAVFHAHGKVGKSSKLNEVWGTGSVDIKVKGPPAARVLNATGSYWTHFDVS